MDFDDDSCECIEEDVLDPETIRKGKEILQTHTQTLGSQWIFRFEKDAAKYWDIFYKCNGNRFYKDRHYLDTVFPEFNQCNSSPNDPFYLLEVGCGVGNAFFPLSETFPNLKIYATDFSKNAVQIIQSNPKYDSNRIHVWASDATKDPIIDHLDSNTMDFVLILFALSANSPSNMEAFLQNSIQGLKKGGYVFFRDYAKYDLAELRFNSNRRIQDHFYARQDGTRTYYFEKDEVIELFGKCHLQPIEVKYICRTIINRKTGQEMNRIWIQGRFQKTV